jgi:lysophospholipase L1-like esterase
MEAHVSRSRLFCVLLAALVIVALATSGPAPAATVTNYVALGDSYASGVGAGDYIGSSGSCDRSPNAYSALWAAAHSPASYVSVACSGATTATVRSTQLSALSASTTLVSITVGGNDVGFTTVIEDCILEGTSGCVSAVDKAEATARTTLPGALAGVYSTIRRDSPSAHVVVIGYPDFYDLSVTGCVGLSSTSRAKINEGADVLDGVIRSTAAAQGFTYGDVRAAFGGHQICDSSPWLHSLNFFDVTESYHPFAAGQAGAYLPVFTAAA